MTKISAVIAAAGLGTRLKNYKDNSHTKVLINIKENSMISSQITQIASWGVNKFVVITNPEFHQLIKDDLSKSHKNKNIRFAIQTEPLGIAHALKQAENIINKDDKILFVLGDNFFGENPIKDIDLKNKNSCFFIKEVSNPEEFGIAYFENKKLISIEEKPKSPKSNFAVIGLYLYNYNCFELIDKLVFSERGELEITDLNNQLIASEKVDFKIFNSWWIDAGTEERILELRSLI